MTWSWLANSCAWARSSSVELRNITTARGCFVVGGPKSREVLAKLTDTPLDNTTFPWLTGRTIEAGLADADAGRVETVEEVRRSFGLPE